MKLEQSLTVQAPIEDVWTALLDIERVAPCLPGADVSAGAEEGVYEGTFAVKLGPTTASYQGSLRMESVDAEARVATMRAEGRDRRGQGGAKASIVSRLTEEGGATRVDVDTDFTITGRLARFGRGGMIEDVSERLLAQFADCLQERLGGTGEAAASAASPEPPRVGEDETVSPPPGVNPPEDASEGVEAKAAPPPRAEPAAAPPPPRPPAEPFDAGAMLGSLVKERAREAAPLLALALLLGWLAGRRRR